MREQRLFSRLLPAIAFTNNILVSYICTVLTDQILFIFYEVCMTAFLKNISCHFSAIFFLYLCSIILHLCHL